MGGGEEGARRSWRQEKMIEQVGALGLNQEVLRENLITGCWVQMQQWETSAKEIGVVWSLVWTSSASPAGLELPEL